MANQNINHTPISCALNNSHRHFFMLNAQLRENKITVCWKKMCLVLKKVFINLLHEQTLHEHNGELIITYSKVGGNKLFLKIWLFCYFKGHLCKRYYSSTGQYLKT